MKYDPKWLQEQANILGSWNKVCATHGISPKTIDSYKKKGLLHNILKDPIDIDIIQKMYDEGMSIRQISKKLEIPHSRFSKKIITRNKKEAIAICNKTISQEGKEKLSNLAKERSLGGYRPHPNKGKRYKDIWFDSNWEIKVALSLDENNVLWKRPKDGFVWNDQGRKYYPDFFLPEYNVYLDPKNDYLIKKDQTKIFEAQKRNNICVIVLTGNELNWDCIYPKISSSSLTEK